LIGIFGDAEHHAQRFTIRPSDGPPQALIKDEQFRIDANPDLSGMVFQQRCELLPREGGCGHFAIAD